MRQFSWSLFQLADRLQNQIRGGTNLLQFLCKIVLLVGTRELGIWHMSCIIGRRPVLCLPLEAQVPVHLNTFLQ